VPVENIYAQNEKGQGDLVLALERQFATSMLLKGLPTWNIPLAQTLNHLPPQAHRNFIPPTAVTKDRDSECGSADVLRAPSS
jgi:hypothetical protein